MTLSKPRVSLDPPTSGFFYACEIAMNRHSTEYLVVHCASTRPGQDFGAADIRSWHKARGWRDIGYHFVIRLDGTIEPGRPLEHEGAHVSGHNHESVGICLIGGLDEKGAPAATFTDAQYVSLRLLLDGLGQRYPGAVIRGHRDFFGVAKACPCFDVREWFEGGAGV